jgi:hypothetical protein
LLKQGAKDLRRRRRAAALLAASGDLPVSCTPLASFCMTGVDKPYACSPCGSPAHRKDAQSSVAATHKLRRAGAIDRYTARE